MRSTVSSQENTSSPAHISRRTALGAIGAMGGGLWLGSCGESGGRSGGVVTLYTSADAFVAQPIAREAERATGLSVRLVTDTEATKTLALMQRLRSERARPRADVWWSSEALATITLAGEQLLAPWRPIALDQEFAGLWPMGLTDDIHWYGFAQRARVIAYHTGRFASADEAPDTLEALCDPRLKGRVGLARPQFGTTRTHLAAYAAMSGVEALRAWLGRFKANEPRLYAGNSAVVQGLSVGEVDVGLTDTDDVWVGQAQGWPVGLRLERASEAGEMDPRVVLPSSGAIVIPNTVGVVANGPNPAGGRAVAEFLVSAACERVLAVSESRNVPVRQALAEELSRADGRLSFGVAASVAWGRLAEVLPASDGLLREAFPA